MKNPDDLLYVGTHGHVTAIGKQRGRKVWSTSLPNTGYDIVTLLVEDDAVYAISKGYLFAHDASTGHIMWKNDLKGLGHGYSTLATTRAATDPSTTIKAKAARTTQAAASS